MQKQHEGVILQSVAGCQCRSIHVFKRPCSIYSKRGTWFNKRKWIEAPFPLTKAKRGTCTSRMSLTVDDSSPLAVLSSSGSILRWWTNSFNATQNSKSIWTYMNTQIIKHHDEQNSKNIIKARCCSLNMFLGLWMFCFLTVTAYVWIRNPCIQGQEQKPTESQTGINKCLDEKV